MRETLRIFGGFSRVVVADKPPHQFALGGELEWGYTYHMFKLLDKAFWKFASGFVLVLIISFSLLTISGVWREAKKNYAGLFEAFYTEK